MAESGLVVEGAYRDVKNVVMNAGTASRFEIAVKPEIVYEDGTIYTIFQPISGSVEQFMV